jgi:hypothetical protein
MNGNNMKKILMITLSLSSITAFAQENYDEINKKNADQVNIDYQTKKTTKREERKTAIKQFINGSIDGVEDFFTVDQTNFPEHQTFNAIENDQIKLLSCIRDLIQDQ